MDPNRPTRLSVSQSEHGLVDNYIQVFGWLRSQQNRDGSWGTWRRFDKISWTSQVILAYSALFETPEDLNSYKKGIAYLRTKVTYNDEYWYFRIVPLLRAGDHSLLKEDIAQLNTLIRNEKVDLWFQAVVAYELKLAQSPETLTIDIADKLRGMVQESPTSQGLAYFNEITDKDCLYALTLLICGSAKDEDAARKVCNWVTHRQTAQKNGLALSWDDSHSKTALISIDLMYFFKHANTANTEKTRLENIISKSLFWFSPTTSGAIPNDKSKNRSFKSTNSIYTSALYLRAVGMYINVMGDKGSQLKDILLFKAVSRIRGGGRSLRFALVIIVYAVFFFALVGGMESFMNGADRKGFLLGFVASLLVFILQEILSFLKPQA